MVVTLFGLAERTVNGVFATDVHHSVSVEIVEIVPTLRVKPLISYPSASFLSER